MKRVFRENGLSIALFSLFFVSQLGLTIAGYLQHNAEQADHGRPRTSYWDYLRSADLLEATMENWESEFLQLFTYVALTAVLYQKGSSESKKFGGSENFDRPSAKRRRNVPWPVRKGGWVLKVYKYSLSLVFLILFVMSFFLHALGGARVHSEQEIAHGGHPSTVFEYMKSSQFWFESLQNWQSEFLSIGLMVVLSIFLRQSGSPESKPVDSPHSETGR